MIRVRPPIHPGEILREEFLIPLNLSSYSLAKALAVPRTRVERLAREETPVGPDTALRLSRYFGTSPEFWMNLQVAYDLACAEAGKEAELSAIAPRTAA
jgi:addiction module HigA family antidote